MILETVVSHMLWSSALSQYLCNQLQVFLHELKMPQRVKSSQQVQNCDSTNPTNLLHYPRVSQNSFWLKNVFRLLAFHLLVCPQRCLSCDKAEHPVTEA